MSLPHRARFHWIPAEKVHKLICDDCGETLLEDAAEFKEFFDNPGVVVNLTSAIECVAETNTLGVHVVDDLGVEDHFGGD